ncbi:MAG: AraC family transcriptional regulator [Saccharospirillaceae bacterium]|nr:AraC family transcriptional regulator [Saccharospirillaceae bacterium]MCD8531662.1 AraC family transcriptional regulator [Saccharospirillaceae bacterium]
MKTANSGAEKTVSILWIKALLQGAELQGIAAEPLLQAAGISRELLNTTYARVSLAQTLRMWRAAEEYCPADDFGLLMGELVKPAHFQLFALTLMHSPDLGAAFEKSVRYTRLLSDGGRYFLQQNEHEAAVCYEPQADDFSRHQVDAVLVLLRSFASWLACKPVALLRVELTHAEPANVDNYQRIFAAPLQFNATRNALVFAPEMMAEPLALGDEKLAAMHEQMLEEQLALLQQPDTAGLVQHFLRNSNDLSVDRDQLAQRLHMSGRTLQRKLQENQTSFQQLLDAERQRRALILLTSTSLPLTQISEQLGFSESSTFTRAFKRWEGIAPLEYRQQHKAASS